MKKEIINQIKALITNKGKDTYYTEIAISVDDDGNLCFIGIDTNCDGEIFFLDTIAPTGEKKEP